MRRLTTIAILVAATLIMGALLFSSIQTPNSLMPPDREDVALSSSQLRDELQRDRSPRVPDESARPVGSGQAIEAHGPSASACASGRIQFSDGTPVGGIDYALRAADGSRVCLGRTSESGDWQVPEALESLPNQFLEFQVKPNVTFELRGKIVGAHALLTVPLLRQLRITASRLATDATARVLVMIHLLDELGSLSDSIDVQSGIAGLDGLYRISDKALALEADDLVLDLPAIGNYWVSAISANALVHPAEYKGISPPASLHFTIAMDPGASRLALTVDGKPISASGFAHLVRGGSARTLTIMNGMAQWFSGAVPADRLIVRLDDGRLKECLVGQLEFDDGTRQYLVDISDAVAPLKIALPSEWQTGRIRVVLISMGSGELRFVSGESAIHDKGIPFAIHGKTASMLYRVPRDWALVWFVFDDGSTAVCRSVGTDQATAVEEPGLGIHTVDPARIEQLLRLASSSVSVTFELRIGTDWVPIDYKTFESAKQLLNLEWTVKRPAVAESRLIAKYRSGAERQTRELSR